MLEELKKSLCIGLDDTQVKLIMPKEIPDDESGGDELQFQRLIEKMKEAKKANQDSIDAKMWGTRGSTLLRPMMYSTSVYRGIAMARKKPWSVMKVTRWQTVIQGIYM
jgi:hypothetical protein